MKTTLAAPATIDEYIAAVPKDVQPLLKKIRATVRKAAPGVEETISYRIPSFKLHGRQLVYFAAFKTHIGLYPAPTGNAAFKKEAQAYGAGKGTFRFPLDKPIPYAVVAKVVKFRAKENEARVSKKR